MNFPRIRQAITLYGGRLAFHYLGRINPASPAASPPLPALATGPP
jgi:hypothetical protein